MFDGIEFRKNNYTEIFLDEELMENQPMVGISYEMDEETKKIIKSLKLTDKQKRNLFEKVKSFGDNISILKITRIDNLSLNWIPSFRSAILIVNSKDRKFYYNIGEKIAYNLDDGKSVQTLELKSKFYLIIFANSNMIV